MLRTRIYSNKEKTNANYVIDTDTEIKKKKNTLHLFIVLCIS